MGVLDGAEKKLEGAVSNVFARAFKGDVQPIELTARLQRELDTQAQILGRDRKLVPNEFHIALSPHDFAHITPYALTMNADIVPQLQSYAAQRGYIFNGAIVIDYAENPRLPVGRFTVTSQAVADVDAAPMPSPLRPSRPAALAIEVNGARHPLRQPGVTIGRGADADMRINDPGISRLHARILVNGLGANAALSIEDLGSTNGITVDGQRVKNAVLRVGSRIGIGNTVLAIVAVNDV